MILEFVTFKTPADWDRARVRDLPDHMLQGVPRGTDLAPNTPQNTRLEE